MEDTNEPLIDAIYGHGRYLYTIVLCVWAVDNNWKFNLQFGLHKISLLGIGILKKVEQDFA